MLNTYAALFPISADTGALRLAPNTPYISLHQPSYLNRIAIAKIQLVGSAHSKH
jgi:hypothetical protein